MVFYAKSKRSEAEQLRKKLIALNIISCNYPVHKDEEHIYFPLVKNDATLDIVEFSSPRIVHKPRNLKEALSGVMNEEQMKNLIRGFDIIGSIVVIEILDEFKNLEKEIALAILKIHPNIKTICKRVGKHSTKFRTLPVEVIAGEKNLETIYTEHGVRMKVRVGDVYFSPRLGTERLRIADLVQDNEEIACLFAGVGPFALVIAKNKPCKIHAVEFNPIGVDLMTENLGLNKLKGQVLPILGDIDDVSLPLCDRVLMLAPKQAQDHLEKAFSITKPGGVIHFYQFANDVDPFTAAISKAEAVAKKLGKKIEVLHKQIVLPHSPRVSHVCIDFKVV